MTEDAYTLQYNQVVVEEAERHADVSGRYPFHNSVWRETYLRSMNLASVDGMLLRSTFLSGGSLYLSHQEYRTSLSTKAADIERDCILTDAEIAHNSEGIRLFFELDYRTSKSPLPSMETALLHIRVIYRTVQDCFPQVANYLVMHVMTCTRKRKQMRSTGSIQLAWGVHLVFPSIVITTTKMKLVAQLADTRLANLFPQWSSIVDPASYRATSATLRPCFSYKWVRCPICSVGRTAPSTSTSTTKRRRSDPDVESMFRLQLSDSCSCFNGNVVEPSVYVYAGSLSGADEPVQMVLEGTLTILQETSIIPAQMGLIPDGLFHRPLDMGDEHDNIPISDTLFPVERRTVTGYQKRKNSVQLDLGDHVAGCRALLQILRRVHDRYLHLAIHRITLDSKARTFFITVKGCGSRFCMYRSAVHNSNRIYFSIDIRRARVRAHCFDVDCKREHSGCPIERALTLSDKYSLTRGFGLSDPTPRPTISPAVVEEEGGGMQLVVLPAVLPPTPTVVAATKREIWLEKRRVYQLNRASAAPTHL